MKYAGKTDIGLKRRNNQDSYAILARNDCICAVVCDGMGGAKGGNVASNLAVKTFVTTVKKAIDRNKDGSLNEDEIKTLLEDALYNANEEVYNRSVGDEELEGMGTTLAAVIVSPAGCFAINIGDSRIYLQKDGELKQISKDHSFVQYLVDKGEITREQAADHPDKNIILRAVGVNETATGDIFKIGDYDWILICSDGLTNHVSNDAITKIIAENTYSNGRKRSLKAKIDELIDKANANGGGDNITAVLLEK